MIIQWIESTHNKRRQHSLSKLTLAEHETDMDWVLFPVFYWVTGVALV